jgi:hypothetical protein
LKRVLASSSAMRPLQRSTMPLAAGGAAKSGDVPRLAQSSLNDQTGSSGLQVVYNVLKINGVHKHKPRSPTPDEKY